MSSTIITQCPGYIGNLTASATAYNTSNCTINLCQGECVKITSCGRPESNFGDSYLRLFNNESVQVCENDDDPNAECGTAVTSAIKYYRGETGCADFILREGCLLDTYCGGAFEYEITPNCNETGFADCNFVASTDDPSVDNGQVVSVPDTTVIWIILAVVAVCVLVPFVYWVQQPLIAIFTYEAPALPPVKVRKTRVVKNAHANEGDFDDISTAEGVEFGHGGGTMASRMSGGGTSSQPIGTKTDAFPNDGYNQLQLTEF